MMLTTQETLERKINELMKIHLKTTETLMDKVDKIIQEQQRTSNGVKIVDANPLRQYLKSLRAEVVTQMRKYISI